MSASSRALIPDKNNVDQYQISEMCHIVYPQDWSTVWFACQSDSAVMSSRSKPQCVCDVISGSWSSPAKSKKPVIFQEGPFDLEEKLLQKKKLCNDFPIEGNVRGGG